MNAWTQTPTCVIRIAALRPENLLIFLKTTTQKSSGMSQIELEVKQLIVTSLKLDDITADDIDSVEPLFGEGLALDSIDALELGVAIRQRYGIKIETVSAEIRTHFANVRSLARFIESQRVAS